MPLEFDGVNGIIKNTTSDGDITIKGNDGGSEISLLTFDVSAEGAATFNSTITSTASTTITVADNSDNLTLVSTDADANSGPNLRLYRNSSSPADSDVLGQIDFEGRNDNSQDYVAAQIKTATGDVSDGTEDAQIEFDVMTGGTLTEYMRMSSGSTPSVIFNEGSADIDFRVESNGNANMLFIDGGNDHVNIGTSSDLGGTLNVSGTGVFQTADNSNTITLISTDADDVSGPRLSFQRQSGSPADADNLGQIYFTGKDSAGNNIDYATILSQANDVTDGTEDGILSFQTVINGTSREGIRISDGGVVVNELSQDLDFRVESDGNTNMLFVDAGNNVVRVGSSSHTNSLIASNHELIVGDESSGASGIAIIAPNNENSYLSFFDPDNSGSFRGSINYNHSSDFLRFYVSGNERTRIDSDGNVLVAKTSASGGNTVGIQLQAIGQGLFTRDGGTVMNITRNSDDGELMKFIQDGSQEGVISVSGTTVSFSGFTGSHWSRLADNSKPTILRGTIMESIDEMCDWYQAVADVAESTDDDGTVTPAHQVKESIALGSKSVGNAITFTSNGTEYTGTIVKEGDVKHTKCKVSDTADSKKVYGVFSNWDDQDDGLDGDVNDMNIAQVGTYIIRVNKDVTVSAGDLLVSNGDGTAKKQDDDIIRSKTVAKVNSNIKVETYSDGSYTVPCTLHC